MGSTCFSRDIVQLMPLITKLFMLSWDFLRNLHIVYKRGGFMDNLLITIYVIIFTVFLLIVKTKLQSYLLKSGKKYIGKKEDNLSYLRGSRKDN